MLRRAAVLASVAGLTLALAAPASADAPTRREFTIHNVVEDQGDVCGFPVRWTIDLTVEQYRFFDSDGRLVRIDSHVKENNTIANLDTGLTIQEGPDAFLQRVIPNPDGTTTIVINGLSVNVRAGSEGFRDVGRYVIEIGPGQYDVVFSAGPHPLRDLATSPAVGKELLAAFCDVLS
ncbi:MAG TPA: hypothetical protein VHJ34_02150 [Actinomycetota bacterium]|nr:hypothetical protein [Actinomycetota bacterium]